MGTPFDYYLIDHKRDIAYPEQRVAVKQETRHGFIVSMGIADPTVFFDPKKKFAENVAMVCGKNHTRARYFKEGSDFQRAYYAGMCTLHDEKTFAREAVPILYFDTHVNLKKNGKDMHERITPLTVRQTSSMIYGSYSFTSFENKDTDLVASEEERLDVATDFIEQLQEIPELYGYCLRNTHNPHNPCLGDIYSAAVTHIIKSAASYGAYDMKQKKANLHLLTHMSVKDDQQRTIGKSYVTLEKYAQTKDKIGCSRMTAPYRDMAATYNVWQWKKLAEGKHPEGGKEAQRAATFLNEQEALFKLAPSVPMHQHCARQTRKYA